VIPPPAGALEVPERKSLPVAISGGGVAGFTVTLEVLCQLTDEKFAEWQLNAFGKIYQSYLNLQNDYEQAVGQSQQSLSGMTFPGSTPEENARITQMELKKAMIGLCTQRQFDAVAPPWSPATSYDQGAIVTYKGILYTSLQPGNEDLTPGQQAAAASWNPLVPPAYAAATAYAAGEAVTYGGATYVSLVAANTGNAPDVSPGWWGPTAPLTAVDQNLPSWSGQGPPATASEIDFSSLFQQAPLIRFMEEAFEWDQMQYIFYPYYWNTKSAWFDLALISGPDSMFNLFLRSGAARVVVPVRPGFEESFVYFLQTGKPWDGGSPPQVVDSNYINIAAEIAEADEAPVADTLISPTWTENVPTTLTMLRELDLTYPNWVAATTYPLGAVTAYNNAQYRSIQAENLGNEPDTSPTWWVSFDSSLPSWSLDTDLAVLAAN
jgi:hypothetical protein